MYSLTLFGAMYKLIYFLYVKNATTAIIIIIYFILKINIKYKKS